MIQFCSWHFTGICGVKWIWEGKGRLRKGNSDGIIDVSFWAFPVPTDLSWGLSVSNLVADRKESLIDHTIVKKQIHLDRSIDQSINQSIDNWRLCARTPQTVGCCPGAKVLSAKIRRTARSWSTSNFAYVAPCKDRGRLYTVYPFESGLR